MQPARESDRLTTPVPPAAEPTRGLAQVAWAVLPDAHLNLPWTHDPVARGLRAIRRREQLYHLIAVFLGCASATLAYLLVEMSADRIWELESLTRLTLLHALAAALVLGGGSLAALVLIRRHHPLRLAREIDHNLGFDDEALLTYVDLRRRRKLDPAEREAQRCHDSGME